MHTKPHMFWPSSSTMLHDTWANGHCNEAHTPMSVFVLQGLRPEDEGGR